MGVKSGTTSDDVVTTHQFDNYGRTIATHTQAGSKDLGASSYRYTDGETNSTGSNIKQLNRISSTSRTGATAKNHIKNSSFETNGNLTVAAWAGTNTFTADYDSTQKYFGNRSYKLNCTEYVGGSRARAYQNVYSTKPNTTYTLSGYVKVSALTNTGSIYGAGLGATPFREDGTAIQDFLSEHIKYSDTAVNNGAEASGWARADAVPLVIQELDKLENEKRKFRIAVLMRYTDGSAIWKDPANFNHTISDWQFSSSPFTLKDPDSPTKIPKSINLYMMYEHQSNYAYFDDVQLIKENSPTYTYNSEGELVTVAENAKKMGSMEYNNSNLTKSIDAKGWAYEYKYDSKHNMTEAKSQRGIRYMYTYNTNGISTKLEVKSSDNALAMQSNAEYTNNDDYVSKTKDADGTETTFTYDQNRGVLKSTTGSGTTINYNYDSNTNALLSVQNAPTDGSEPSINVYSYTEGTFRNLVEINNNGTEYGMTYDEFNNPVTTTVGSQNLVTNVYDAKNGLLERVNYGNGNYIQYVYDAAGNIVSQKSNGVEQYTWVSNNTGASAKQIDKVNNQQHESDYDSIGRPTRLVTTRTDVASHADSVLFSTEYGYDLNNNVNKLIFIEPGGKATNTFDYGKDNLIEKQTLPSGKKVTYSYDTLGRLTKTSLDTPTIFNKEYTYAASKRGGIYTTSKIAQEKIGNSTYDYEYDTKGNITKIKLNGDVVAAYTYDSLSRMTSETAQEGLLTYITDYEYDAAGNILSKTTTKEYPALNGNEQIAPEVTTKTYTYGNNGWKDQLTSYSDYGTITYDQIGNPLSYGDISFEWQNGRQLKKSTIDGTSYTYKYDSGGLRTSKTASTGETHTYYYVGGTLMYETKGDKKLVYSYDATGNPVSVKYYFSTTAAPRHFYYDTNMRGDVIAIRGTAGTVLASYEYDSWGKLISSSDVSSEGIGSANSLRYRGYYYDTELKMYYLQSRYYDPETGRFINADGFLQAGAALNATNMYAYCVDNPVNYFDPTGKASVYRPGIQYQPSSWLSHMHKVKVAAKSAANATTITKSSTKVASTIVKIVAASVYALVTRKASWSEVKSDIKNYSFYNTDEQKVLDSNVFSSYKGTPVIRHEIAGITSFSISNTIVLNKNRVNAETVRHEWGHTNQQALIGDVKYITKIAIPSVAFNLLGFQGKDYYSLPWERSADIFGGVSRDHGYYAGSDILSGLYLLSP